MLTTTTSQTYFRRHIALPQDHGSWVFLLSPLLIGLFAGSSFTIASVYLIVAAFSAFLIRQPTTIVIKVYSGRRPKRELQPALFWMALYGLVGGLTVTGLVLLGYPYLLYLAVPGLPVFAWHLYLVSKRAERRQIGVELVGSGVLALAAPAALWVSAGEPLTAGWLLWALAWFQSAASIVYAYLRLEQRSLEGLPVRAERIKMAGRALAYSGFNLAAVTIMAVASLVPALLPLPYALQFLETVRGSLNPAIGVKPTSIGIRQLIVSSLFTVLFIVTWNL
jgi:YwiC-like protein